jgi:hypothetical protein
VEAAANAIRTCGMARGEKGTVVSNN